MDWVLNVAVGCRSSCGGCRHRRCCICTFGLAQCVRRPRCRGSSRPATNGDFRRRWGWGSRWRCRDFVQLDRSLGAILDIRFAVDKVGPDALHGANIAARQGERAIREGFKNIVGKRRICTPIIVNIFHLRCASSSRDYLDGGKGRRGIISVPSILGSNVLAETWKLFDY